MLISERPANDAERVQEVRELNMLDTPIDPAFERITRLAKALLNVPIASISLIDSESQWLKSTQGLDFYENDRDKSFCTYTILNDNAFIVNDAEHDQRFYNHPHVINSPNIRFYAGYPLKSRSGFNVGTLCLVDKKKRDFTSEEIEQLKDMAALVEEELIKYKQHYSELLALQELDQANRAKLIDPLTRIWNRSGIEIIFKDQINKTANGSSFAVYMIDIDNFKRINDTYGHCAGDVVLCETTKRILDAFGRDVYFGRWGGEEFLGICPIPEKEANNKHFLRIAEKARLKVSESAIKYEDKEIDVSITMGVTTYKPNQELLTLISEADEALYKGKNSGKNKVVYLNEGK